MSFDEVKKKKKKEKEKGLEFVTRLEWGAREPVGKGSRLRPPVSHIRYAYTGTQPCRKRDACDTLLQKYQKEQIDKGLYDQPYNFLVGGDGAIYEGRGWEIEAQRPASLRGLDGKCIDIAYIGTFETSLPTPKMSEAAEKFVTQSIEQKKISDMPTVMDLHDFRAVDD